MTDIIANRFLFQKRPICLLLIMPRQRDPTLEALFVRFPKFEKIRLEFKKNMLRSKGTDKQQKLTKCIPGCPFVFKYIQNFKRHLKLVHHDDFEKMMR